MSVVTHIYRSLRRAIDGPDAGGRTRLRVWLDMVLHLTWRDFTLRYRHSVLGVLWSLLLPLIQLLLFVFLFQVVVPLNIPAYPVYVFTGLLPWTWFSAVVGAAPLTFFSNRALLRYPTLSPVMLVAVSALAGLVTFLLGLPLLLVAMLGYGLLPTAQLLLLPLLIAIQFALTVGVSLALATLNVFFRDLQHLTGVALMLLFYATPVFYSPRNTLPASHWFFQLNPMAVLVQAYRDVFYGQGPSWGGLLWAAAVAALALLAGYLTYSARRHEMFDHL